MNKKQRILTVIGMIGTVITTFTASVFGAISISLEGSVPAILYVTYAFLGFSLIGSILTSIPSIVSKIEAGNIKDASEEVSKIITDTTEKVKEINKDENIKKGS